MVVTPGPDRRDARTVTRRFFAGESGLLLAAVLLVAVNLRGAIAAVSPVLPRLRDELSLSPTSAGLLTTLPVLCFALAAPGVTWLVRRTGLRSAVLLGCLAIAAATVVRVLGGPMLLLIGTLVAGVAMTVGNVCVPVAVKSGFGRHAGTVTGLYTASLAGGAAATAALAAPLAQWWGWRAGLAIWAVLALAAAGVWWAATRRRATPPRGTTPDTPADDLQHGPTTPGGNRARVWRDPVAWAVTLFLGLQSVCYYSVTTWLPTLLVDDAGLDLATAGAAMSVFQVVGIAGSLTIPLLVRRRPSQSGLGALIGGGWLLTLTGLFAAPSAWLLWGVIGGLVQGAGLSFVFTVLILRAHDSAVATTLSGMSQLIGYAIGAAGPAVVGALYGMTHAWTVPLVFLLMVAAAQGVAGVVAGRDHTVGAPREPDTAETPAR